MNRSHPVENVDAAVTAAAELFLEALSRHVTDHAASARVLVTASLPFYGVTWGRSAIGKNARSRISAIGMNERHMIL